MKKITAIFFLIAAFNASVAQVTFKTEAPQTPVIAGESFQVQYILENAGDESVFIPPDFRNFRLVNGPYVYKGNGSVKNFIYALEAIKPGKFVIPSAAVNINGHIIKSNNLIIEVISKQAKAASGNFFFLQPGEDPYKAIRENLFVKVFVSRNTCFVGEPVIATFKLYSRLESRSDIIKSPGFYGFTVQDMVGLEDKQVAAEVIGGKRFDVHTIRMVQLYPLQAGVFTIEPMEVQNKVTIPKSAVYNKPEQEIIEGVLPRDAANESNSAEIYENNISTGAIRITVKPFPKRNKPIDFTGATGRFNINTSVDNNMLDSNEEGHLKVTISGKGNFPQLTAPTIHWPEGVEGFVPHIKDLLDSQKAPLTGERTFSFPFIPVKAGSYTIPAISFSFFDPDTNSYKTVSSKAISITVNTSKGSSVIEKSNPGPGKSNRGLWITGLILLLIAGAATITWLRKNKKKKESIQQKEAKPVLPGIDEILNPVLSLSTENDKTFYAVLRHCILNFFSLYFDLAGSKMSRQNLIAVMRQRNTDDKARNEILEILEHCETGIFTGAYSEIDRQKLIRKTREVLKQIQNP